MPTSTTNYGLIKPGTDDPILIEQLNDNADTIDAALKENADAIENKPDAADIPTPSTAAPAMDGTASPGTSEEYARADHIHPSDTSKQDALTTAQLAAANSGIDSTKVEQIETNKNNISNRTGDGVALTANTNLNDIVDYGQYPSSTAVTATLINLPDVAKTSKGRLLVLGAHVASNLRVTQIWLCDMSTSTTKGKIMMRQKYGDAAWTNWFMFEGTELVPN